MTTIRATVVEKVTFHGRESDMDERETGFGHQAETTPACHGIEIKNAPPQILKIVD